MATATNSTFVDVQGKKKDKLQQSIRTAGEWFGEGLANIRDDLPTTFWCSVFILLLLCHLALSDNGLSQDGIEMENDTVSVYDIDWLGNYDSLELIIMDWTELNSWMDNGISWTVKDNRQWLNCDVNLGGWTPNSSATGLSMERPTAVNGRWQCDKLLCCLFGNFTFCVNLWDCNAAVINSRISMINNGNGQWFLTNWCKLVPNDSLAPSRAQWVCYGSLTYSSVERQSGLFHLSSVNSVNMVIVGNMASVSSVELMVHCNSTSMDSRDPVNLGDNCDLSAEWLQHGRYLAEAGVSSQMGNNLGVMNNGQWHFGNVCFNVEWLYLLNSANLSKWSPSAIESSLSSLKNSVEWSRSDVVVMDIGNRANLREWMPKQQIILGDMVPSSVEWSHGDTIICIGDSAAEWLHFDLGVEHSSKEFVMAIMLSKSNVEWPHGMFDLAEELGPSQLMIKNNLFYWCVRNNHGMIRSVSDYLDNSVAILDVHWLIDFGNWQILMNLSNLGEWIPNCVAWPHINKGNDQLCKLVGNCDNVFEFMMNHSVGDGSESKLNTLIYESSKNSIERKKLDDMVFSSLLTMSVGQVGVHLGDPVRLDKIDAYFKEAGELRFVGEMNVDLNEFQTNLVWTLQEIDMKNNDRMMSNNVTIVLFILIGIRLCKNLYLVMNRIEQFWSNWTWDTCVSFSECEKFVE